MLGGTLGTARRALLVFAATLGLPGALQAQDARQLMQPLPLSLTGQPVPGFPNGAPASPPDVLRLSSDEIERLKRGRYTAGIAMQALDTPWNSLQVEAISSKSVLGQVAVVRSGRVTASHGEAVLEDGGAGLILRVRADEALGFKRGDRVVLLEYLAAEHAYRIITEEEFRGV